MCSEKGIQFVLVQLLGETYLHDLGQVGNLWEDVVVVVVVVVVVRYWIVL